PAVVGIGHVLGAAVGLDVVVGRRRRAVGPAQAHAALLEAGIGGRRAVMHQVTVDIEQGVAIRPVHHDVALPDLLEHCPRGGHFLVPFYSAAALISSRKAVRRASQSAAPKRANVLAGEDSTKGGGNLPSRFTSASVWSQIAMMLPSSRP